MPPRRRAVSPRYGTACKLPAGRGLLALSPRSQADRQAAARQRGFPESTVTHAAAGALPPQEQTVLRTDDIEAIAPRVVELLDRPTPRLLTAGELARLLVVDVAFVYAHQHELGVLRLPGGRRPACASIATPSSSGCGDAQPPQARIHRRPAARRTPPRPADLFAL